MKKTILFLLCLVAVLSAESRTMRIGDSQYFKAKEDAEETVKITLVDVQNGVAVLKKETVQNQVSSIGYYYLAPKKSTVAPIELQPYPAIVTSDYIDIRGICEPGQKVFLYETSGEKIFSQSVLSKTQDFSYDNGNFSIRLPLKKGENSFFFSYASDVIGSRALATVTREDPPLDLLKMDLDPIGSSNIRKTNIIIQDVKNGSLVGIESILGKSIGQTDKKIESVGNVLFEMDNTYTDAMERNFHVILLNELNNMISHNTMVLPVNDDRPSCEINFNENVFSTLRTLNGTYESEQGVRFVWVRILNSMGVEYSRAFVDVGKRLNGTLSLTYSSSGFMNLRVGDENGGVINQSYIKVPEEELNYGEEYSVEIGVTDVSGNRSNTYVYSLSESAFEKIIDISLLDGIPATTLYDYPVLVELNTTNFDFSKAQDTGDDISFFGSDGLRLSAEKEFYSKDKEKGLFWVKVPSVNAYSSSIRMKVRWDNPLAEPAGGESVWNEGYTGVYHFNERYISAQIPSVTYSGFVVYATGSFSYGERCEINGTYKMNGEEAIDVGILPNPGTQDVKLSVDGTVSLIPGMYGDVVLDSRSKLNLRTGIYHFKSLTINSDAFLNVDNSNGVVDIKVEGNVRVSDRVSLNLEEKTDVSTMRMEVMGSSVNFDRDITWNGILSAPNANVRVLERTVWNGAVYAQNIEFGSDVTINGASSKTVYAYKVDENSVFPSLNIAGYGIYAKNRISIESSSKITGSVGSEGDVSIGDGAVVYGNLMAWNDLALWNHASLFGDVVIGGSVQENANTNWNGVAIPLVEKNELEIPSVSTQVGSEQVEVYNDKKVNLAPGLYANLRVNDRGKVILQDGVYYFTSLNLSNDAEIDLDENAKEVIVVVSGKMNISERVKINQKDANLVLKVAGAEGVSIGGDSKINAKIIAPNSSVVLNDRVAFNGSIWAYNVSLGHNVAFVSTTTVSSTTTVATASAAIKSDWIADATFYRNNGVPHSAYSKCEFIAAYEYFTDAGSIDFKENSYFKPQKGTISAWLYFDDVSGRFAASSNEASPDWELNRTLEGNVVVSVRGVNVRVPVPEQAWIHFAVSIEQESVNVYLNGELVASGESRIMSDNYSPWIGKNGDGLMKVDELRFSNVVRDESWIRVDYITQKQNYVETGVSEYAFVF